MIASGDFKMLESDLKRLMIRLYSDYEQIDNLQINFMQALDDNYFPFVGKNFDYLKGEAIIENYHESVTVRNFIAFAISEMSLHIQTYEQAKATANKLDSLISIQVN